MHRLSKLMRGDEGSNLVEFAICALVFLAALFGIMYFSLAFYTSHVIADATDNAARYAIVRGSSWSGMSCQSTAAYDCDATSNDINNFVQKALPPAIVPAGLTVSTSWPGTNANGKACDTENGANSPNCLVVIQINYSFSLPIPLIGQRVLPISSSSSMTIAR
jgi:Flp pilus assembly protein TadG